MTTLHRTEPQTGGDGQMGDGVLRPSAFRSHANRHGCRGVWLDEKRGKYLARIYIGDKRLTSPRFDTAAAAGHWYQETLARVRGLEIDQAELVDRGQLDGTCVSGHELAGDNLYVSPSGTRNCRKCNAQSATNYYHGRKKKP